MNNVVTLTGYIVVPGDELEQVIKALEIHKELTLQEAGCISFSVQQRESEPCIFDVAEEFESKQAFELHQQRVAESDWGRVTKNVKRHYQVSGA